MTQLGLRREGLESYLQILSWYYWGGYRFECQFGKIIMVKCSGGHTKSPWCWPFNRLPFYINHPTSQSVINTFSMTYNVSVFLTIDALNIYKKKWQFFPFIQSDYGTDIYFTRPTLLGRLSSYSYTILMYGQCWFTYGKYLPCIFHFPDFSHRRTSKLLRLTLTGSDTIIVIQE